jgi:hypothetical protein
MINQDTDEHKIANYIDYMIGHLINQSDWIKSHPIQDNDIQSITEHTESIGNTISILYQHMIDLGYPIEVHNIEGIEHHKRNHKINQVLDDTR